MTDQDITKTVDHVRQHGPARVVINIHGEAIAPCREGYIVPDVIFIRNDGWSLGAPADLELVAHRLWSQEWIAVTRSPFETWEKL